MKRRTVRQLAAAAVVVTAAAALGWRLLPQRPLLDGIPFSEIVRDRDGQILRIALASDGRFRVYTPLASVSPRIVQATLFHEDRHFSVHPGVNAVALARATWHWMIGPSQGGASTITMQVARLRYGLQTRTLLGKGVQIFDALCLERHYSKKQILEAYFNLAPYGGNIEGVAAASWIYLHHGPDRMSWPEAATLSVIPQSPFRRRPLPGRENRSLTVADERLYGQLLTAGLASDPLGLGYRLQFAGRLPMRAPHFTTAILATTAGRPEVCTTLDGRDQDLLEHGIRDYVDRHGASGVHNASAMLIDTRNLEVLASVGSAGFWNQAIDGQVDGTRRPRSPGSALKPFIYALALDQGLIDPQSLLIDAPRRFSDYCPDNFDREFCGPISAADALARSRNVPVVDLAARLRAPTFYELLRRAEIPLAGSEQSYGLSLALGSEDVTMEDMVRLYAMLANGGILRPLQKIAGSAPVKGFRLLSPEASFLTMDMLSEIPRPDGTPADPSRVVCWKTGTSHGCRDAWSIAVFDHYVLAVWIGNFKGPGNPAFVGRSCAGPLLFQMIDQFVADGRARLGPLVPPSGANLRRIDFCAVSGDLPGPNCPDRRPGWFIPGVSPIAVCSVHRQVLVDRTTGLRKLQDDGNCRHEVFEFWSSNVLRLFEQAGLPRRTPPPFEPSCAIDLLARKGSPPRIVSPTAGQAYAIRSGDVVGSEVPLSAQTDGDVAKVHWFAGSEYLGCAAPGQTLAWHARPGNWRIVALDDQGRSATRMVAVLAAAR